jgi:hypothetical protein
MDGRTPYSGADDGTVQHIEVRLYGQRGAELARESLYEDE